MYSFEWDKRAGGTGGYRLTTQTTKFVASEIRPVFAEELEMTGLDSRLSFEPKEQLPLLWAKQNVYIFRGEEVAKLNKTQYGKPLDVEWLFEGKKKLVPVDVAAMVKKNREAMTALVSDTLKRIKEMYDAYVNRCDAVYIGFSGGKDSVVLLDLCHKVLPLDVPVIFSDTDMELPDTYRIWDEVQKRYPERQFVKVSASRRALENWRLFGPPSRSVRWCCAVHKSAPALVELKRRSGRASIIAAAFVGVRGEESLNRANYQDIGEGVKNSSQTNLMPILDWAAHELWIYLFGNELSINPAYRYGLARVGCIMCPESSEKYAWFVNAAYPQIIKPFEKVIVETNSKQFDTEDEAREFVGSTNWQARKSGVALRKHVSRPTERAEGNTLTWQSHDLRIPMFMQWLKTVGKIEHEPDCDQFLLKMPRGNVIPFIVQDQGGSGGNVEFSFTSADERKTIAPTILRVLQKAVSCIGCQACEAECPTGALTSTAKGIKVNELLCVHCLRCHSADFGCWRFKSMYKSDYTSSGMNSINAYNNFGLRRDFLSIYLEEKEAFAETMRLNKRKQVPAAKSWFRQALLMDAKTCAPTRLLDLFEHRGIEDALAWDCVWLGLCNHAAIVKWFVCALELDVPYSDEQLFTLLGTDIKDVTKKGGLQALKNMLVSSPFGAENGGICEMLKKGAHTVGLIRRVHEVEQLVILYGLYVTAEKARRGTFTVRQLMDKPDAVGEGFIEAFISPMVAFGLSPDTFKKHCLGLATQYPDLIACSFTLGLDEVRVFPETKTRDDVLAAIMKRA